MFQIRNDAPQKLSYKTFSTHFITDTGKVFFNVFCLTFSTHLIADNPNGIFSNLFFWGSSSFLA